MIYVYEPCCGIDWERTCSLREYQNDPSFRCPSCGRVLAQVLTPPRIFTKKFEPYRSPVDGTMISTARELAEHNKRNRVVQLHEGYDEKAVQNFVNRDWHNVPEKERKADLKNDMEKVIQKLEEGYKPAPKPYTEEVPDA